jgi:membrane protein
MKMRLNLTGLIEISRYYIKGMFKEIYTNNVFLWAQAIAFKVLITIVPLILLATGLAGNVLKGERPFRSVEAIIRDILPSYQSDQIVSFLSQLQSVSSTLTWIGVVGLTVTAVTLFTTLRTVLANVFAEEWHEHRSLLRGYLFDFRMTLQVGLLFVASTFITFARETINETSLDRMQQLGLDPVMLQDWLHRALDYFGVVLPLLLSTAMFFQLIYLTPRPRPRWRSALSGALFTAILWEAAKRGFTSYATSFGSFEQTGLAALGDSFGLIIVIVFWAYFSGLILTMGAIVTLLHERRNNKSGHISVLSEKSDLYAAHSSEMTVRDLVDE